MIENLIITFLIWANQDDSGLRLYYSILVFSILIFLIYKVLYYLFYREKCKVIDFFLFLIKIFFFFFWFKTDSVCEAEEEEKFTWFTVFSWLFVGLGICVSSYYTIDEIVYNNVFDITEVFNPEIEDGFYINYRGIKHYYWRGTNLTVSNNNWRNLTIWEQNQWWSANLNHSKIMHQRLCAAQKLQNYRVETDLLWDMNWNEHIIKNSGKHRLAYQKLEYLVEKNRIMYNNIAWNCYNLDYNKQMCENCISNSFKVYKLHDSIKFKLQ